MTSTTHSKKGSPEASLNAYMKINDYNENN